MPQRKFCIIIIYIFSLISLIPRPVSAEEAYDPLDTFSLADLMNMEITITREKEQTQVHTTAAVFVVTQEDIRRAGISNIPEALRMVPGLHVARVNSNTWAITSRGFNSYPSGKLLVLMDGRNLYTPLYAGVIWDEHNLLMEDVDRIEIIRGPGATLWGVNAVNGIINIITKSAKQTHGNLVSLRAGNYERALAGARHGGQLGDDFHYRVYAKFSEYGAYDNYYDEETTGAWRTGRAGFRTEWDISQKDTLTFQGDVQDGTIGQINKDVKEETSGMNLLTRWERELDNGGNMSLQFYYDKLEREDDALLKSQDTFDLDFVHRFQLGQSHNILYGFGFRYKDDKLKPPEDSATVYYTPDEEQQELYTAFVQDTISLIPDRLRFTLGTKFEYFEYTGTEIQPSARLLWMLGEDHVLWGAVSRAVKTPSRAERGIHIKAGTTTYHGNPDFESETLIAYELGHRIRLGKNFFLDSTMFYNDYDKLKTREPLAPKNKMYDNLMHGESYGFEMAGTWNVTENWRLTAAYSYMDMLLFLDDPSEDADSLADEDESPHNQFSLRSMLNLRHNIELDASVYYVDRLRGDRTNADKYVRCDLRLGWCPNEHIELVIGAHNLFDGHHPEYEDVYMSRGSLRLPKRNTETIRDFYAQLVWRF